MKKYNKILILACALASILMIGCSSDADPTNPNQQSNDIIPELTIEAAIAIETDSGGKMDFEVSSNRSDFTKDITFQFETKGITAEPGKDFTTVSGQGTIPVGSNSYIISVDILNDDEREIDELLEVTISNAQEATIARATNTGSITDNDMSLLGDEDGYNTPTSYFGFSQIWNEDFDGAEVDEERYNFELGDGCPDICGWGNEELQNYTNDQKNIKLENGRMAITASQEDVLSFTSARLTTKDKVEFQYGRIDVRAKLPKGQGLWPAIWMLGENIDEVGWPACGEIDIMELVGHKANQVSGTAHWGERGQPSTFRTSTYTQATDFSDGFHVFTLVWELNKMTWYVDERKFHTLQRSDVDGQWRFNQPFFFIFNVAVGGRFPGDPDETTVFPQTMEMDYIRVFQPN